jgi:hypothetical protein
MPKSGLAIMHRDDAEEALRENKILALRRFIAYIKESAL